MKKLILLIFGFIFLINFKVSSQSVVISEYYNVSGTPQGEWTELIVVDDNISIVGYVLRDNTGENNLTDWQGGVIFKDVRLWRNLRKGTIILINHRTSTYTDTDASDGYIEVDAADETYFEKVMFCPGCDLSSWSQKALNIAQVAEIMQLLNSTSQNVHTLAHMNGPKGDWIGITGAKISYNADVANGASVRVVPGRNLSEYAMGYDASRQYTFSSTMHSKGKPNTSTTYPQENYKFWHELRRPDWSNPKVTVSLTTSGVNLNWNSAIDNYSSDNIHGYLILRIPSDEISNAGRPIDGKMYNKNDKIGSAVVVDNVTSSTTTSYLDDFNFECGKSYFYRIYAFKFSSNPLDNDVNSDPYNQRGRIYNSSSLFTSENSFAESEIISKKAPSKPTIQIKKGNQTICSGEIVVLTFTPKEQVNIEWYKNNTLINFQNSDTLLVKESGLYNVKVTNKDNCSETSFQFEVKVFDKPSAKIGLNSRYITKDTVITLCSGSKLPISVAGGEEYILLKDNKVLSQSQFSNFVLEEKGSYRVIAVNQKQCYDTSLTINLKVINVNFTVNKNRLDIILSKNEFSKEDSIVIKNLSNDTLFIDDIALKSYFEIISPNKPYTINPNSEKTFIIRFKTTSSGLFEDILFIKSDCNKKDSVLLIGNKPSTDVTSSLAELTYPLMFECDKFDRDSNLVIYNNGNFKITLKQPMLNLPFEVISPKFPIDIDSGKYQEIKIKLNSNTNGIFNSMMKIPFTALTDNDTIRINITAKIIKPDYNFENNLVDFKILNTCNEWVDTTITILNNSEEDLILDKSPSNDLVIKESLPIIIKAKEKSKIRISLNIKTFGNFNQTYNFSLNPCNVIKPISFVGEKNGLTYSINSDTIDFGEVVINCTDSLIKKKIIINVSDLTLNPIISNYSFDNNNDFKSNIQKNYKLNKTNEFEVEFYPLSDGNFINYVDLDFEPCSVNKRIYLKGRRTTFNYELTENNIDFGNNQIPIDISKDIRLKNTGSSNIVIAKINSSNSKFTLDKTIITPLKIDKGDYFYIKMNYKSDFVGSDTAIIELEIDYPCNKKIVLYSYGKSYDNRIDTSYILIDANIKDNKGKINETIDIPIELSLNKNSDSLNLKINVLESYFRFNGSLLLPIKIINSNNSKIIKDTKFNETKAGNLKITTEYLNDFNLSEKQSYVLSFKVLAGNSNLTLIYLDSISGKSNKRLKGNNIKSGLFEKTDNFNTDINSENEIFINSDKSDKDNLIIVYNSKNNEEVHVYLYNYIGQLINKNKFSSMVGNNEIIFNTSNLPYGVYFIIFEFSNDRKVINFNLVK